MICLRNAPDKVLGVDAVTKHDAKTDVVGENVLVPPGSDGGRSLQVRVLRGVDLEVRRSQWFVDSGPTSV